MLSLGQDTFGNEQFIDTDAASGDITLTTKYADAKAITDRNAELRKTGHGNGKEWKLAASIPLSLIMKWKIEHGVDAFSSDPAHKKRFRALLNDHEFKMLRVWEGNI